MGLQALPRVPLYCVYYIVYAASFLMPRSKYIWLFDEWHGTRFADNPRHLFLYVHAHQSHIKAVWISHMPELIAELRAKGFRVHHAHSLMGLWYTLRAKVIMFESTISVFFWLTGGMTMINLWHGLPIKKVVYDSARTKKENWVYTATGFRRLYHVFFHPEKVALGDYVLAQSPPWKEFFSSAFRVDPSHVLVENQPRNIALIANDVFALESEKKLILEMESYRKTKKIVTYLPTFRDGSADPLRGSGIDFRVLDDVLESHSMHLYIKMHHERGVTAEKELFRNISFLSPEAGMMHLLRRSDILVTDYSSVFMEFLVVDRPIIFFCFDRANYSGVSRDFYFEYDTITPGPKVETFAGLCDELIRSAAGVDNFVEERRKIRTLTLRPEPERAPEKVYAMITGILSR